MGFYLLIGSIIFVFFMLLFYWINRNKGLYVKSKIDEHYYFVSDIPNKQQIADTLAQIKKNIKILLIHMNNQSNPKYIKYVNRLKNKINDVKIIENTNDKYTSYSVNKGEELVICVRSRKTDEIHDINLIMYVILHEIAHIMCPEYGHGELFNRIFKYVTEEAIKANIYEYINFDTNPQEYCGLNIKSSII